jgi:hypothetical protein
MSVREASKFNRCRSDGFLMAGQDFNFKRLPENGEGSCFRGNGPRTRHEEGAPQARGELENEYPAGRFRENPPGGGSFAGGRRWLGHDSPLRGCAGLAAWATVKIPRRRTPPRFRTGSKNIQSCLDAVTTPGTTSPFQGLSCGGDNCRNSINSALEKCCAKRHASFGSVPL